MGIYAFFAAAAGLFFLWLLAFDAVLDLQAGFGAMLSATGLTIAAGALVYRLRGHLPALASRESWQAGPDGYRRVSEFAERLDGTTGLRVHESELLAIVVAALGCRRAALLLLEGGETDYTGCLEGSGELRLRRRSPLTQHIRKENRPVAVAALARLPGLGQPWQRELGELRARGVVMLAPLVTSDGLAGVLALGERPGVGYRRRETALLGNIADRLAIGLEKGRLRQQRRGYEEELTVMNRASVIIASSLDVPNIFDGLVEELAKGVEIGWAGVSLIEDDQVRLLAVSSSLGSAWEADDRMPLGDTATEWLSAHGQPIVEPDLVLGSRFVTGRHHLQQGVRSIAYFPLVAAGEVIGSLDIASPNPDAFPPRHVDLLQRIATQIATQIGNSRLYREAVRMARLDDLTGLENRRSMSEAIAREIERCSRYGGEFAVVVLDIDSLKQINDNYGHPTGDEYLRQVGQIMGIAIRSSDCAFRQGGDEFAILLPRTGVDSALEVAERVRWQVATNTREPGIPVTVSLGVASWPEHGSDATTVLAAADAALYQAKRNGGNCCHRAGDRVAVSGDVRHFSGDVRHSG